MGSEVKRKRGGQPGNQNGRVHGLYSKSLTTQEQQYLQSVLKITGVDLEVGILYTKIVSILATDPNNQDALYSAISSLDRLLGYDRQKLTDTLRVILHAAEITQLFPGLRSPSLPQDESGTT